MKRDIIINNQRSAPLFLVLESVVNGDHSEDAMAALYFAAKEYRQSAPGYAQRRIDGIPSRETTSDTSDITTALRDEDFVSLNRIYDRWLA